MFYDFIPVEIRFNTIAEYSVVITVSAAIEAAFLAVDSHLKEPPVRIVVCNIPGTEFRTTPFRFIDPDDSHINFTDFIGNAVGVCGSEISSSAYSFYIIVG